MERQIVLHTHGLVFNLPFAETTTPLWVVRELIWHSQQQLPTSTFMPLLSPTNLAFIKHTRQCNSSQRAHPSLLCPCSTCSEPKKIQLWLRGSNLKNTGLWTSVQDAIDVELGWQLQSVVESRKTRAGDGVVLLGFAFFWIRSFCTY